MQALSAKRIKELFSPFYHEVDFLDRITIESTINSERISNGFFSIYALEPNATFMIAHLKGTELQTEMYYGLHETRVARGGVS